MESCDDDVAVPLDNFHSSHCDNCFNFKQCDKRRRRQKSDKSDEDERILCPIISCRLTCGHHFHECKRLEHELLCPKAKVPCINKDYGCPLHLERRLRGQHLERCPASVIVCTMEWSRWPLGKVRPFPLNPDQLDVASTLRDQATLSEWKELVPSTLRYLLKNFMHERHPMMPLGVAGRRIPKSVLNQTIIENNLRLEGDVSEESEEYDESSSDSPWGWKKCPPGLQESMCSKLKSLVVGPAAETQTGGPSSDVVTPQVNHKGVNCCDGGSSTNPTENLPNGAVVIGKRKSTSGVDLSLMVEVRTRCQKKPDAMYTFICSREFRRDEYPSHFSHIHSNIHTQLNGWLFMRCPMAALGCEYGIERMQPVDENYNVVFNPSVDSFCFSQNSHEGDADAKTDDNNTTVSLSSLPFELIVNLTKYLDPLSLNALSMTNQLFRDACSCVVVERGIIVFQWEKKQEGVGWEVVDKKWIFSTAFSEIRKWKFGDVGRMITHMKTCPFFERNIPTKPFAYPITKEQL